MIALALILGILAQQEATPATIAALPPAETGGAGARLPFYSLEGEDGRTDGTVLGPDRTPGTLPSEASGRRAIRLTPGQSLTLTLPAAADAITVRYALPDSVDGRGVDAAVELLAEGERLAKLSVTSRYSWYYGAYPYSNDPTRGSAQHFYDHARLKLPRMLPAGTRLTLRLPPATAAEWVAIDVADFEQVPAPAPPPARALSVLRYGADPSGRRPSRVAFQRAIDAGRRLNRPVWVPPGTYRIDGHLRLDRVTLVGAGHWHSVLSGRGIGLFGKPAPTGSRNVHISGLAIIGEVSNRDDKAQLQAIGGAMSDSVIEDLWIQHTKVGLWMSGPMTKLSIRRVRVYDQAADGVNFHGGVTGSLVEDSFFRNLGDDGLAMWSHRHENAGNVFRRNTVVSPVLANGIAIYGGRDITVADNLVADTVRQGGGLHLGARFDATPFAGTIRFSGNQAVRAGVLDENWGFGVGALWIYALDRPIDSAAIRLTDNRLTDSSHAAIQFLGKAIRGVTIDGLSIERTGTAAFQLQAPGQASVARVTATGVGGPGTLQDGKGFVLQDGGGNSGWPGRAPMP